jgi:hypothetical protein
MTRAWILAVCAAAGGCASTKSVTQDKMLGYTDHNHFVIEHHDPAHGGRIVGTICAVDIQVDVKRRRDGFRLVGDASDRHATTEGMTLDSATGAWVPTGGQQVPILIEARDEPGRATRRITGVIGDAEARTVGRMSVPHGIELALSRESVRGQVGTRTFDLSARGDDYIGSLRIADARMPFVLRGSEQLWAMPAAAQAAILPLLLTCTGERSIIQMVDLRQSDTPPPAPPRWLGPPASQPHRSL